MSAVMSSPAAPAAMLPASPSLVQRFDSYALSIGSRLTVSTLMLACVLVIIAGASSMLSSLKSMNEDLQVINKQLAIVNQSNVLLNKTLDSMPPSSAGLKTVVGTVRETAGEVGSSSTQLKSLAGTSTDLAGSLSEIAAQTKQLGSSLQKTDATTGTLGQTVTTLNQRIDPLVATQRRTRMQVAQLNTGLGGMNGSLAYVVRTMNYLTAPPSGQGFMAKVQVDASSLPPIPGLKAEVDPVEVFRRGVWPVYTGP